MVVLMVVVCFLLSFLITGIIEQCDEAKCVNMDNAEFT